MPRDLSEYSLREWSHIRPLVERYKQARTDVRNAWAMRAAPAASLSRAMQRLSGRRVLVSVAFNQPETIEVQARLIARFVPDCIHVVGDNSSNGDAAGRIEAVAERNGAIYARVPRSMQSGKHPSHSHGFALTWLWRRVIRPAKPQAFGFLDHDIFPMRPTDPFAALARCPVAGRVWDRAPRWHLWAGFSFFRFDAVCGLALDFGPDFAAGLDTGGRNWWPLYRGLDRLSIDDPGSRLEAILPGVDAADTAIEWCGDWLHERRFGYDQTLHDRKHAEVMRMVNAALAEPAQAATRPADVADDGYGVALNARVH